MISERIGLVLLMILYIYDTIIYIYIPRTFRMKITPTSASLLVLSLCLGCVVGWWDIGHMTVSQIAVNRLK